MTEHQYFIYVLRPSRPEMLSEGLTEREAAVVAEHYHYILALPAGSTWLAGRPIMTNLLLGWC